jgi:hypothetical protein
MKSCTEFLHIVMVASVFIRCSRSSRSEIAAVARKVLLRIGTEISMTKT